MNNMCYAYVHKLLSVCVPIPIHAHTYVRVHAHFVSLFATPHLVHLLCPPFNPSSVAVLKPLPQGTSVGDIINLGMSSVRLFIRIKYVDLQNYCIM